MKLYALIGEGWAGDYEDESDKLLYTLPKAFFTTKKEAEELAKKFNGNMEDPDFDIYDDHHYTWVVHEFIVGETRKGRKKK